MNTQQTFSGSASKLAPTLEIDLSAMGVAHIRYPSSKDADQIISSLGQVLLKTEIRENHKSTRLLASSSGMGFHTDHNAANYIAWFCNSQAATGGESLLLDTTKIFAHFSEGSRMLLQEVSVKTHQVFHNDKLSIPLLTIDDTNQKKSVYYAPWLVNTPPCSKHRRVLEKFELEIKNATPIKLLLSEGDLLIIDNHRMLHGRNQFPANSNRWLTRYWIKSK